MPARKEIHAIVDNYATHKHPKVRQWLARHPRWAFHFTPISASWLNAVEGFFATLTKRRLKRGVFVSVVDLQAAINRFVVEHNAEPKPFRWTADPDKIIQAVRRGHQVFQFHPLGALTRLADLACRFRVDFGFRGFARSEERRNVFTCVASSSRTPKPPTVIKRVTFAI